MLFENAIQLAGRDSWWDGSIFLQDVLLGASRVTWSILVWERSMSSWPFVPLVVVVAPVRSVTLDYYQSIFGNFVEVEGTACHDGWRPRCSMQPCCTAALTHSVGGLWFFSWVADWLDNQVYTRSQSNDQRSRSSFCVSLQACQLTWIHKHTLYIYTYTWIHQLGTAEVSDSFRRFHEVFYGNYRIETCALWRKNNLPIAWHGRSADTNLPWR